MLKFTYLFNFGLMGALVVPAAIQQGTSVEQLTHAIRSSEQALESLGGIEEQLANGEYAGVDAILAATEAPFGGERERTELLDQLRREIGQLESRLQDVELPSVLDYLNDDPTASMQLGPEGEPGSPGGIATTGLSESLRTGVGDIWPPIATETEAPLARKSGDKFTVEKPGFTADALRQGRAYYRASRYQEALVLFNTREGEAEADYWIGRCLERLDRASEAVAAYTRVIENEASGALGERAESDREFLRWLIDFDRKVVDHRASTGEKK